MQSQASPSFDSLADCRAAVNHAQDDNQQVGTGGQEVDFQLNNETYYIDLADEEGKWLVFAQTPTGVRRIPVYIDAPESEDLRLLVGDNQSRKVVN